MTERLLTPEEVAERLQVSRLTVMAYLRSGALRGRKVGRLWRVSEEDLRAFVEGDRVPFRSRTQVVADAVRREASAPPDAADYQGTRPVRAPFPVLSDAGPGSDLEWLDRDWGEIPPWEWGPQGPPSGLPVEYVPGVGLVIRGSKRRGE